MLLWAALVLYFPILAGVSFYAIRYGAWDERTTTFALLLAVALSQVASLFGAGWRSGPEYGVMIVDMLLLAAMFEIVRRSRKFWPLWATAAQLVGTLTHLIRFVEPSLRIEVFASIQPLWVFPQLLAIVIGTSNHRLQKRMNL